MKIRWHIHAVGLVLLLLPYVVSAQEIEESAEVYLEEYSDDFQENFFEALKQKGIENYDKAIDLLLKCKALGKENSIVDHELAKAYLGDKQYFLAQEYSITAVKADPTNEWYLSTLIQILEKQGSNLEAVKSQIPYDNNALREHLGSIYFRRGNYKKALLSLKGIAYSPYVSELTQKINDSLEQQKQTVVTTTFTVSNTNETNPLDLYKVRIAGFIRNNNLTILDTISEEALETYPSQPYFYYARGYFFNKKMKHKEAIEVLEVALDYLIDDISLANKIYNELADAYTANRNMAKANMYRSKVKPGF